MFKLGDNDQKPTGQSVVKIVTIRRPTVNQILSKSLDIPSARLHLATPILHTHPMMNKKIKAIIFDIGGVLIRTADRTHRNKLERRLGLNQGESEILVFNGEMGKKAQLGLITSAELYGWIQAHLGLDAAGIQQFKDEFWAGDTLDTELVDFIRQLKQKYTVCIISNFMDALPHMLKTDYPAADAFHFTVVSAHVGVMKPAPEIFEYTLKLLNLRPDETVFIDDFQHNIEGCKAVGMHGILFKPDLDLKAKLEEFGVKL